MTHMIFGKALPSHRTKLVAPVTPPTAAVAPPGIDEDPAASSMAESVSEENRSGESCISDQGVAEFHLKMGYGVVQHVK